MSITCEDTAGNPLAGVEVWVTSDAAGNNPVAGPLTTGEAGEVVFMLAAGTWWLWRQAAGLALAANPQGDHSLMDKFRRYRSLCQTRFDAAVEEAGQMRLTGMTLRQIAKRQKCASPRSNTAWIAPASCGSRTPPTATNCGSPASSRDSSCFGARPGSSGRRSKPDKRQKSATESSVPKESIATTERRTGNPAWIDKLIRIHARIAALKGLDAPKRREIIARPDGAPISTEQFTDDELAVIIAGGPAWADGSPVTAEQITDDELAAIVAGYHPAPPGGGGYVDATSSPEEDAELHPIHVPELSGQPSPPSSSGVP